MEASIISGSIIALGLFSYSGIKLNRYIKRLYNYRIFEAFNGVLCFSGLLLLIASISAYRHASEFTVLFYILFISGVITIGILFIRSLVKTNLLVAGSAVIVQIISSVMTLFVGFSLWIAF